jgi:hypothetical protein
MSWWSTPLRVSVPWARRLPTSPVLVPVSGVQRVAGAVSVVLPTALAVVGIVMAVGGAVAAERPGTEAVGTLATELGAALWFGGVLTLGARGGATVGRAFGLAGLALGGALLVALAWVLAWEGAALALAMELGVGAVAVAVLDVLLLGLLYGGLTRIADTPESVVQVTVTRVPPFVQARTVPPASGATGTAVGDGADAP